MMKLIKNIVFLSFFVFLACAGMSQNCSCTISEVENNHVNPCDLIIGIIDTVSTTIELRNAINNANATGGNRTILIENGIYPISSPSWYPYITASNMVFRSLHGNRDSVIITGTGMGSVAPGTEMGFYFVGNNNTIADLTIREVGNHGIAVQGDSLFVHNVKIQNTFEQMLKGTSAGDGADHCRVQCSLFEYPAGIGPQFYIGGLDIHEGNNWVVNDNIFRNIASPSGSLAEHAIHFWNFSANNTIERNMIVNCDRGIGFGLGSSPNDGGIIRNNMIYNDGNGLFDDVGIGLESSPNTKVYNNTIFIDYPNAIEYRFTSTTNVDIANNLTNRLIKSRDGGAANLTANYTNALNTWFIDPSQGNLRLNAFYPEAVDAGTDGVNVSMDIDQTPRPQSSSFDIGAHEFQITSVNDMVYPPVDVSIHPNPATNHFSLKSNSKSIFNIEILNLLGQPIIHYNKIRLSPEFMIDTGSWQAGYYICKISEIQSNMNSIHLIVVL